MTLYLRTAPEIAVSLESTPGLVGLFTATHVRVLALTFPAQTSAPALVSSLTSSESRCCQCLHFPAWLACSRGGGESRQPVPELSSLPEVCLGAVSVGRYARRIWPPCTN